MVSSGNSTIFNDPWANPRTGAGTKAPPEAPPYDENSYEPEDKEDGTSTQWRSSPSEFGREPQVRESGAGQNADNLWAKSMQMSPRTTEVDAATKHASTKVAGQTSRKLTPEEASAEADESADIERTERALLAELQRVAERRRSLRASLSMIQPTEEAIADDEPETTVEEIMQRGKTRERLAAERAQAEARHVEGDVREAFAQQRAAEAEARERHMAQELEHMRLTLASMHHKAFAHGICVVFSRKWCCFFPYAFKCILMHSDAFSTFSLHFIRLHSSPAAWYCI